MDHILDSYFGLGDNIYHIPFVHRLAREGNVYIYTPFPELFQFPNVYCYRPATNLKLQAYNMTGNGLYAKSAGYKPSGKRLRFNYGADFKLGKTLMQSFEALVPLHGEFYFEYTPPRAHEVDSILDRVRTSGKKLCVVRLPSVRTEWPCPNRNSKMEYFQACINALKDEYYFVSVGDIGNHEEYVGEAPSGIDELRDHVRQNHLALWCVIDLVRRSDLVLSIQCNMIPICQLLRKKAFIIYGGYVPHKALNDARFFQLGFVEPEPFCFCINNGRDGQHQCHKDISNDRLLGTLKDYLCRN